MQISSRQIQSNSELTEKQYRHRLVFPPTDLDILVIMYVREGGKNIQKLFLSDSG